MRAKIYNSIFSTKYTYTDIIYNENPNRYIKINEADKVHISVYLFNVLVSTKYDNLVLNYIVHKLNRNSNAIRIKLKYLNEYYNVNITKKEFDEAIINLINRFIIRKTNEEDIYVINHNYIFIGDLRDFIVRYTKKYGNKVAKVDDEGNIIINEIIEKPLFVGTNVTYKYRK